MMAAKRVQAFLWDFDGTLVDTRRKNFQVMRTIVAEVAPEAVQRPAVVGQAEYERCQAETANWRDFYIRHLGFDDDRTDQVGRLWTEYQLRDRSEVPAFDGVRDTLDELRDYPHSILSQNAKPIILRILGDLGMDQHFGSVVGYEEVPIRKQKPEPDGLLLCLQKLRLESGWILFVGDHPSDTLTARNANKVLQTTGTAIRVLSVAAAYGARQPCHDWPVQPDFIARQPTDLSLIRRRLETGLD